MSIYYQDERVTLHHGTCLDVLASLPNESIDAVCTDPPYGLSNTDPRHVADTIVRWVNGDREYLPPVKGGFMGQEWDSFVPPVAVWDECLRVLKPGGHLLAFAGPRTMDLMGLGIRLAGFDIRDSIAWLYGCLTADADVLTDRGWVNGLDVQEGDLVAQWDHETGRVELAPVERTFRAPWDGPMRVLRSSDTDQVLTPNHRVYHQTYEREQVAGTRTGSWSGWKVAEAGDLSTWQATRLPIAGTHDGPGIGGEDYAALLGWVWTEGGFDQSGTGVRIYQSSANPEKCDDIAALLDRMGPHKRYDYARTYTRRNGQAHPHTASTWFFSGELANRVRADLPGKRPTYDLLWRMTADEKRAMLRAAMLGDGSGWGGRSPQFYQKHEDDLVWMQTLLALIDRAGKVTMRPNRPGGQLSLRQRGTTDLQARHLGNSTEHYTGEVWCVKVPSGAFLARRNGRVFITGNSGFPKSLDVSKAIDKRPGVSQHPAFAAHLAERRQAAGLSRADVSERVVGTRTGACWNWEHHQFPEAKWWPALRDLLDLDDETWGPVIAEAERAKVGTRAGNRLAVAPGQGVDRSAIDLDVTTHATPAAERWQGWGSAMKPAFEPVVVARKPLIGTIAQNVLQHGTGALNVDACRVEGEDGRPYPSMRSNTFLLDGCASVSELERLAEVDGKTPTGRSARATLSRYMAARGTGRQDSPAGRWPTNVVLDDSQSAALDEQSGERPSGARNNGGESRDDETDWRFKGGTGQADTGGASRFFKVISQTPDFPTFRGGPQCMLWVCGSMSANTAEIPSSTSLAQPAATAPERATTSNDASTVRAAASAVGLCVSCGTAIAQSLAPPAPAPTPQTLGLPSTGDSSEQILTRSLALIAADLASSGTTLTTPNWTTLLGCAADAINAYTTRASRLAVRRSAPSDPSSDFPRWKYEAKAPTSERPRVNGTAHPTVKPLSLMSWLVRLVTPPGGTVLEPFAGSGTTVEACIIEGFRCIAIEREADYLPLITQRIHRRLDPLEAVRQAGGDLGLFDFGEPA